VSQGLQEELRKLAIDVKNDPDPASAYSRLGTAQRKAGLLGKAEASLRRSVELRPDAYESWVNLGGVLFSLWNFQGSAQALRRAVDCNPQGVEAHYNLGLAHLHMGKPEKAVEDFLRVVELDPEHASGHYYLAAGWNALGKVDAAKASLLKCESLGFSPDPKLVTAIDEALEQDNLSGPFTMEIGEKPTNHSRTGEN
jgi:tetratricopeptide (TPR) repeat protein